MTLWYLAVTFVPAFAALGVMLIGFHTYRDWLFNTGVVLLGFVMIGWLAGAVFLQGGVL